MRAARQLVLFSLCACPFLAHRPIAAAQSTPPAAAPQLEKRPPGYAQQLRQVTLDVAVTDRSGAPAQGLQANDFQVLDNGHPVTGLRLADRPGAQQGSDPPSETLLLLDAINMSPQNLGHAEDQLRSFLRSQGPHLATPISLLILSDTEPRTRTPATQSAQVPTATAMALGNRQAFVRRIPASTDVPTLIQALDDSLASLSRILASQGAEGQSERVQLSLQALDFIATAESKRPGRKLLVWISPGWPLLDASNARSQDKDRLFGTVIYFSRLLQDARITLDAVNPEGVLAGDTQQPLDPSALNRQRFGPLASTRGEGGYDLYENYYKGVSTPKQADSNDLALQVLAYQSGGLVLDHDNHLASQIARCVAEAETFYSLSYELPPSSVSGAYHSLTVKAVRPGLVVRARSGFYAR